MFLKVCVLFVYTLKHIYTWTLLNALSYWDQETGTQQNNSNSNVEYYKKKKKNLHNGLIDGNFAWLSRMRPLASQWCFITDAALSKLTYWYYTAGLILGLHQPNETLL